MTARSSRLNRLRPSVLLMMRRLSLPALAVLGLTASAASAQTAQPFDPSQPRTLSAEQKQQILAHNDETAADRALNSALGGGTGGLLGQVHGEVGVMFGSGGAAGVFGTAQVPLGENGSAIISFEDLRSGNYRRRR